MIWLAITWIPTWVESFLDRKGETKKGKRKDFWWTVVAAIIITGLAWLWFGKNPFTSVLMILMWRFCTFDYITNALLKRYSEGHKNINIWKFTGTVAYYDKLTAKVHWVIRLIARGIVFISCLTYYLLRSDL